MLRWLVALATLALLAPLPEARAQNLVTNVDWSEILGMVTDYFPEAAVVEPYIKGGQDLMGIYEDFSDMADAHGALSEFDGAYDPDYSPEGSPQIPSACADSAECNACYEKAVKDVNFNRFYLDKMRSIANSTIKFAEKSIAFGDNASGYHGITGLAWQSEGRPQIEQAVTELRKTYDRKYKVYIGNLETALKQLGQCEAEHFDEPDWYGRFGYIYYSFMADRYRDPD
jgi:hypothetical protein